MKCLLKACSYLVLSGIIYACAIIISVQCGLLNTANTICEQNKYTEHTYCEPYNEFSAPIVYVFNFVDDHEGFFLVIFTVVLAGFTGFLWYSTDKLWRAGENQFELANKQFIATHRPKVIVRGFHIGSQDIKQRLGIVFTAQNIGNTSATLIEVRSASIFLAPNERLWGNLSYGFVEPLIRSELKSGAKVAVPANGSNPVTDSEYQGMIDGTHILYCLGTLIYEDGIGTRREIGFSRRYFPREDRWDVVESEYEYNY